MHEHCDAIVSAGAGHTAYRIVQLKAFREGMNACESTVPEQELILIDKLIDRIITRWHHTRRLRRIIDVSETIML